MKSTKKIISIDKLHAFENHPYKVQDNEEMEALAESIKENGIVSPVIVRPLENTTEEYEIISGHRRVMASRKAGITEVPALVISLDRDAAAIVLVDSNLHREHILPSEKAFAYKMKAEALAHRGFRADLTSEQLAPKLATEQIADDVGASKDTVKRYIRLTNLIPELLKLVDEHRIAFTPAVELSYLPEHEQRILYEEIEFADATPSLSQSQRLRKFSEQGRLSVDTVFAVLSEEKPNQKEQVRFMTEDIRKYFPKNYSNKDMQQTIIKLLENWQRKRERNAREER